MNKKQEALRRGLRSFIEDASKELADLEGRPLHPPEHPTKSDPVAADDAAQEHPAQESVPRDMDRAEWPRPHPEGGAGPAPEPAVAPASPIVEAGPVSIPPPAPGPGPVAAAPLPPPVITPPRAPRQEKPPVVAEPRQEKPPVVAEPRQETPPVVAEQDRPPAAPREERPRTRRRVVPGSRRRPKAAVRPRPAGETGADGAVPAQVHARKGVCFAYFLNHECWRVADAYCNNALQVCITRECPVYHLHKDALEHRFARKFKHLW